LALRPFTPADAERIVEIRSNWNVSRMLRLAPYPPGLGEACEWLQTHAAEWAVGTAYRFAVVAEGRLIGCADVDEIEDGCGELGYWLDEAAWGRGYASEAAAAVRDFAFGLLGLDLLASGHAFDNPGSGRVLEKLGFGRLNDTTVWSQPRGAAILQHRFELRRLQPSP
jgi:ribosomal-protein-alanine N-acetyltransferase